ncbi:uncharacterized protein BX663DRAFT_512191 [Cokeromyces recurvatus]|uniref:uncharacterized protein n=1 Tax=Cokeromyces recurvatus TaxID=90255 RepID=UPI0022211347|nr:uncharacterized protein BX663DRAFT_512191 [Cokeromyces recurvatus]KAI7902226.1 hypothetical protein BX663DRAFT_512191 [Cokeromyces recurvatus]
MSDYQQISINHQNIYYQVGLDLLFNFTNEFVEYIYTDPNTSVITVNQITIASLNSIVKTYKIERIQSTLYCKSKDCHFLVIIGNDKDNNNHLFWHNVKDKTTSKILTKKPIQGEISQSSISRLPFNVEYKDRKGSSTMKPSYAMVIGTKDQGVKLILLSINELTNDVSSELIESFKTNTKDKKDLGYVTSVFILTVEKGDRRMGHSDPQILLGFSQGNILIYRIRSSVYSSSRSSRIRSPLDLSSFTEYPKYPITHLSCARSYNSLSMTVVFAQEKPKDDPKYQYARDYIKLVAAHGDSTLKQRKIINPPFDIENPIKIVGLSLIPPNGISTESKTYLSIILQNKNNDSYSLNVWKVESDSIHEAFTLTASCDECIEALVSKERTSRPSYTLDMNGFLQNMPSKITEIILEQNKDNMSNRDMSLKRDRDEIESSFNDEHKPAKIRKSKNNRLSPIVIIHHDSDMSRSDEDTNESETDPNDLDNASAINDYDTFMADASILNEEDMTTGKFYVVKEDLDKAAEDIDDILNQPEEMIKTETETIKELTFHSTTDIDMTFTEELTEKDSFMIVDKESIPKDQYVVEHKEETKITLYSEDVLAADVKQFDKETKIEDNIENYSSNNQLITTNQNEIPENQVDQGSINATEINSTKDETISTAEDIIEHKENTIISDEVDYKMDDSIEEQLQKEFEKASDKDDLQKNLNTEVLQEENLSKTNDTISEKSDDFIDVESEAEEMNVTNNKLQSEEETFGNKISSEERHHYDYSHVDDKSVEEQSSITEQDDNHVYTILSSEEEEEEEEDDDDDDETEKSSLGYTVLNTSEEHSEEEFYEPYNKEEFYDVQSFENIDDYESDREDMEEMVEIESNENNNGKSLLFVEREDQIHSDKEEDNTENQHKTEAAYTHPTIDEGISIFKENNNNIENRVSIDEASMAEQAECDLSNLTSTNNPMLIRVNSMLLYLFNTKDIDLDNLDERQYQVIGDYCWRSEEAQLQLFMMKQCHERQLDIEVVMFGRALMNNPEKDALTHEQQIEYKTILKEHIYNVHPSIRFGVILNPYSDSFKVKLQENRRYYINKEWCPIHNLVYFNYYTFGKTI